MGTLRRKVKKYSNLRFVDAPHIIDNGASDSEQRTWFYRESSGAVNVQSLEESLVFLEREWITNGPFCGIIGFSMGGSMASIIAALPNRFPQLSFVITAGSPVVDISVIAAANICNFPPELNAQIPSCVHSLHIAGKQDTAVSMLSSRQLASKFNLDISEFLEHDQGHCFPSKADITDKCTEFISRMSNICRVESVSNTTVEAVCQSITEEDATAQAEEIEVLSVMFPDDITIFLESSKSSLSITEYCSNLLYSHNDILLVRLNTSDCHNAKWNGEISLRITRPWNYPSSACVGVEVLTGKLSLHDLTTSQQTSLIHTVQQCAASIIGIPSIMNCIQAANEWLSNPVEITSKQKQDIEFVESFQNESAEIEDLDIDDMDDATLSKIIRDLSEAAGRKIAAIRNVTFAGEHKTETGASDCATGEVPASARGVWSYTVGLIGKPSAGI